MNHYTAITDPIEQGLRRRAFQQPVSRGQISQGVRWHHKKSIAAQRGGVNHPRRPASGAGVSDKLS